MRLALGSWAFAFGPYAADPWPFARVLEYAASAGYDGIEISGFRPHPHPDDYDTPQKCRELLKMIKGWGLGISAYAPDLTPVPPGEVPTADYLHEIHKCLDFCTSCGIETLRVDTISPPNVWRGVAHDRRLTQLIETWRAAARAARAAGVLVVWEFEHGFWLSKPAEVKDVLDAIADKNFKALFDTSHAYVCGAQRTGRGKQLETVDDALADYGRLLGEHIGHLHLSDTHGTLYGDETGVRTASWGLIDLATALSSIRRVIDRLPWWCVDLSLSADPDIAGRDAVPIVRQLMAEANSG